MAKENAHTEVAASGAAGAAGTNGRRANGRGPLKTPRTKLRRLPARGRHDRETLHAILDEGLVCHLGFVHDGKPAVIPTLHARVGDALYLHGSAASRALRTLSQGVDVCLTVTLVDGLVLARSAFHHSINYRSAVIYGTAHAVTDPDEKTTALEAFTEKVLPGRWEHVRWPNRQELKATSVLVLPIEEASAKIRTGPPIDDDEDHALDVWAGVVPLETRARAPQPDELLRAGIGVPEHVARIVAQ
jgi:nitroimidazol reductase NimA-like FMN-containing flavoprotein (pyridoxamine 5'-phosphate oxidase superfamily)